MLTCAHVDGEESSKDTSRNKLPGQSHNPTTLFRPAEARLRGREEHDALHPFVLGRPQTSVQRHSGIPSLPVLRQRRLWVLDGRVRSDVVEVHGLERRCGRQVARAGLELGRGDGSPFWFEGGPGFDRVNDALDLGVSLSHL